MTQSLAIVVWTVLADGGIDFVNDVWLDYSGQTLDQVARQSAPRRAQHHCGHLPQWHRCRPAFQFRKPLLQGGRRKLPLASQSFCFHESDGATTILLVDDEIAILELLAKFLRRHGYRVLTASDGEMALDTYRRYLASIDAVLLDVGVPKVAGREVLRQMQQAKPDAVIMVARGYPELGVARFLEKPYSPDEVLKSLRIALEAKDSARSADKRAASQR